MNPDTLEPTDNLTALCMDWMKAQGSASAKVSDILDNKDAIVLKAIQQGIDKANDRAISRAQKIQKWSLLPRDFSIPGGELGMINGTIRICHFTKSITLAIEMFDFFELTSLFPLSRFVRDI